MQNIQIRYGEYFKASYGENKVTLVIPHPPEAKESEFDDYELVSLKVCIDGETKTKEFFVKAESSE